MEESLMLVEVQKTPYQVAHSAGYLTPKEATVHFASRPTPKSIRQWMKIGIHDRRSRSDSPERITLRCVREGAIWLTRQEWIAEFQKACQENHK